MLGSYEAVQQTNKLPAPGKRNILVIFALIPLMRMNWIDLSKIKISATINNNKTLYRRTAHPAKHRTFPSSSHPWRQFPSFGFSISACNGCSLRLFDLLFTLSALLCPALGISNKQKSKTVSRLVFTWQFRQTHRPNALLCHFEKCVSNKLLLSHQTTLI